MLSGALLLAALATTPEALETPGDLEAYAYFLVDHQSGAVLAERAADIPMEPASVTKVMTAWVVFRALEAGELRLDETVTVSPHAWRTSMGNSRTFLEPDRDVTVEVLLQGMIIQSGNDASIALAERLSGSEEAFAERMNQEASALGMTHTHFANSNGLPTEGRHVTTARDLTTLASALIDRYPNYYRWFSEREYEHNDIIQYNRNRLLRLDPTVDGIKTGWTVTAGYCILASAQREGRRLIVAVLGAPTSSARTKTASALLERGFEDFETVRLFAAGEPVQSAEVFKGARPTLAMGLTEPLYVTIPRGRQESIDVSVQVDTPLVAPIAAQTPVGAVTVRAEGETVARRELLPLAPLPAGDWWRRTVDAVRLWAR